MQNFSRAYSIKYYYQQQCYYFGMILPFRYFFPFPSEKFPALLRLADYK